MRIIIICIYKVNKNKGTNENRLHLVLYKT